MILRVFLVIVLVLIVFISNAFANPIPKRSKKESKVKYGISYSFEQSGWYGLDAKKTYIELLDELDISWVRLPFFWGLMSRENQELDLSELKFAIEEAGLRNVDVIIALGVKTPYYPELHLPNEIREQIEFGQVVTENHPVAEQILEIDLKVVEELLGYDNIKYWQVENEPLVGVIDKIEVSPGLIAKEIEVVRNTDPGGRPIILNHSGVGIYDSKWRYLIPLLTPDDIFGANAYFKTKGVDLFSFKLFGNVVRIPWPSGLSWPVQSWGIFSPNFLVMKRQAEAEEAKFWILEAQAEPYLQNIEQAKGNNFDFTPQDISRVDLFLKSYDVESIGFWGASFWKYKEINGDPSWLDAVKIIVND